jgi:4-hydroxy-2-oxoheptanedioate aldolase
VQLETKIALEEIEAVAAIEGVDGIFVGPSDVSASLGHLGDTKHPEVQAAIKDAARRIRAAGKSAGFLTGNADEAEAMFELGFNFTAVGNDVTLLASMADNLAARFRKK